MPIKSYQEKPLGGRLDPPLVSEGLTGIKEDSGASIKDTDEVVINICDAKLGMDSTEDSIDKSHKIGRWHPITSQSHTELETPKPTAITVKFIITTIVPMFHSKAELRQTGIAI